MFSRTVASAMKVNAKWARMSVDLNQSSAYYLDPKAIETADLFVFLDELSDSLNGNQIAVHPGKPMRSGIIENKKTDSTNAKLKSETWETIKEKFNASCQGEYRTAKQLHALYNGIKKKARKNLNDDRKEMYKTGRGISAAESNELDMKVVETLGVQFQPLTNPFDSSTKHI
ncbi:hypothetical protein HUJ04_011213 [Dendroctonus ponderosae]|nr:hypothetical protein HUJ04_011213 [Dendroctonus ponderosae]